MDSSSGVPDGASHIGPPTSNTAKRRSKTPDPSATPSTTTTTTTTTTGSQGSKSSSAVNSAHPSPLASRDSSPTRRPRRTASANRLGNRSRKNSQQDLSPARQTRPNLPGPITSSRSLTSTTTPSLLPTLQNQRQEPQDATAQKSINHEPKENPKWPISPRLRSPPPQFPRSGIPSRRSEHELPAIAVQRSSPKPQQLDQQSITSESEMEESQHQSGVRTPVRGALETVQEVSLPNSPNPTHDHVLMEKVKEKLAGSNNHSDSALENIRTLRARPNLITHESGSESGNSRADARRPTSVPPPLLTRQSSALSAKQMRLKHDGPNQSMTVETETVPSVPQVALATGPKVEANGTLKTKPSSETIRPRKEKKKATRKQPAVNPGTGETPFTSSGKVQPKLRHYQSARSLSVAPDTCLSPTSPGGRWPQGDVLGSSWQALPGRAQSLSLHPMTTLLTRKSVASSKADIFEAKINSAIDETNTSDSEETFVYDSNPPDNNDRAHRRFHSRTPSATSMVSQADRQNLRSIYGIMEGAGPAHGPKRSMKFVNTFNNGSDALTTGDEDGKGSSRSAGGSGRGTARHHHHIGRWGRQPGNSHPSLFDNESPFPNAARSKLTSSRNSSGPPSPRNHHSGRNALNTKRTALQMSSSYDFDENRGADDERTPLIGSIRSARSNRRRVPHSLRQAESQTYTRRQSYLNRFAACLVLTMMLMLVVTGAIGFMFATSQPMTDIEITAIHNVVTSEQVLMFDLTVKAHNPNIVVVTIDQANLEIFAKSEFAGTDSDWWDSPEGPRDILPPRNLAKNPRLDEPDDDDDQKPNVLLGRITDFDSPLTFEGSLFNQGTSSSTGQVQLEYPGNQTAGGSRRWERIFQNEFDLIVKGVVKYSLPLSAHVRSATVSGRKTIQPNSANDPSHKPNSTTTDSHH